MPSTVRYMRRMGSLINLRVGQLEVDWGKNNSFVDYNALFQPGDVQNVEYYYSDRLAGPDPDRPKRTVESMDGERWQMVTELREGYSKPLGQVVRRIEMLGHTEAYARAEFTYLAGLNHFDETLFTFDELATVLREVDVTKVSLSYHEGTEDFEKFFRREIFPRLPFARHVRHSQHVRYDAAGAMENMSAYTVLRLLADNPSARDLPVVWAFDDIVSSGWVERADVAHPLAPGERFSILTEGTSDAEILKKALALLEPAVADFFSFVEVGHPFTGTGQVVNFVKGLVAIGVHNNVLVLFDNDAEGCAAKQRCIEVGLPGNVRALTLPDLEDFRAVEVHGPTGRSRADINERAAAIECYLDLGATPEFRWSNYNEKLGTYQGVLIGKDGYKKRFLDQDRPIAGYDYSKIWQVLTTLKRTAIAMNEEAQLRTLSRRREQEDD